VVLLKPSISRIYQLWVQNKGRVQFAVPQYQYPAFESIFNLQVPSRVWFCGCAGFLVFTSPTIRKSCPYFLIRKEEKIEGEKVNKMDFYWMNERLVRNAWWSVGATEYKFLELHFKNLLLFRITILLLRA